MPPESNCVDDADNDCDCLIDGEDGSDCPEGSGIDVSSTHRQCTDGANSDSWNDLPDPPLIDSDDDGCCDICISDGYQFDTAGGARDACAATPDPACDCGTLTLNWESGTTPYCCGDEVPVNEFYRTTTDYDWQPDYTCNTTFGPCPHHACCNESYHCIDELGRCQNGTEELCLDGLDNDCNGLIDVYDPQCRGRVWGYVFDEGRFPIPGATVKGSPPGMPKVFEREATTNAAGRYDIPDAIIGNYSFISRKEGYDDSVKILFIIPNSDQQVNFTLRNGSCHFDCTDYHGNCNPKCDGLVFGPTENCTIISLLCEHRPKGFVVTEPFTSGGVDMIREFTCCEGVPEGTYREYEKRPATVGGDIDDLIDSTFIIKKGGRDIILHIVVTPPLG